MTAGPKYFASPSEFRAWLEKHHTTATELSVGYYKRDSGVASMTWPESVDQALCFGWIDGVRNRVDAQRYRIRFTPRKTTSIWSNINIGRVKGLTKLGLMSPAGLKAFKARSDKKSGVYSFEQRTAATLPAALTKQLEADANAWTYFRAQAPGYQRIAAFWIVSAKKEETRARRFAQLLECSAAGRSIASLTGPGRGPPKARAV